MPEISKIKLPSGTTYTFKDTIARSASAGGGVHFVGISSTEITDESELTQYVVDGELRSADNGDLVIYGRKEFIFSATDLKWHEMGDNGSYGNLAYKDSADAIYTPSGTISTPTFTGEQHTITVQGTPTGAIAIQKAANGTPNYTPEGTVTLPTINVTPTRNTVFVATSDTAGGEAHSGIPAQCTLPTLDLTYNNETLIVDWSEGSFTTNRPTTVTMPTFTQQNLVDGIQSAQYSGNATFTGTGARLVGDFTGDPLSMSTNYTPSGTISRPVFSGEQTVITAN